MPALGPHALRILACSLAVGVLGCAPMPQPSPTLPTAVVPGPSASAAPPTAPPPIPASALPSSPPLSSSPTPAATAPTAPSLPYSAAVAARFPDPAVDYATPAFTDARSGFTTNAELQAVLRGLVRPGEAAGLPGVTLLALGASQNGVPIEALLFSRVGDAAQREVPKVDFKTR